MHYSVELISYVYKYFPILTVPGLGKNSSLCWLIRHKIRWCLPDVLNCLLTLWLRVGAGEEHEGLLRSGRS